MKTIKCFAFFVSFIAASCVPVYYPMQQGGYNPQQQYQGHYTRQAHTTTLRAFIKLGADAPQSVVDRAEQATANQVGFEYARSFESGGRPTWPSLSRVTEIARQKLASNGHSLRPGQPGQPGCFKVMEYRPGVH